MTRHSPSRLAPAGETQTTWSKRACVGTTGLPLWPEWSHQSIHTDQREGEGSSEGSKQWRQPPAHPFGSSVSTGTSTSVMECGVIQETEPTTGTVCDHAEHVVAGSSSCMLQMRDRPRVNWTQAVPGEPTLGTVLPSVCSSVSLSHICNYY